MTIKNNNNDLLRKLDSLLCLLVDHSNTHENCCLKKILGLALTSPGHEPTQFVNKGDCID